MYAWNWLQAETWDTLTADKWDELVTKVNLTDTSTAWDKYIRIWDVQIVWGEYSTKTINNLPVNFIDTNYAITLTPDIYGGYTDTTWRYATVFNKTINSFEPVTYSDYGNYNTGVIWTYIAIWNWR